MTYRRLYRYLFLSSTLALAGLWWLSMRSHSHVSWSPHPGGPVFAGSFHSATIRFRFVSKNTRSSIDTSSIGFTMEPAMIGYLRPRYLATGNLGFAAEDKESMLGDPYQEYRLEIPLWLVWLLLAVGGYPLMKLMEKRAAAVKEEQLATDQADPARLPD